MPNIKDISFESWANDVFPEWGNWLNEEIEDTAVPDGKFAMWWLGCTGIWVKSQGGANLCIDLWLNTGKRTKRGWPQPYGQGKDFQMTRITGGRAIQPNTRTSPMVINPFAIKEIDAVLSTHFHRDHICQYVAAAVCQNTTDVPFIGPQYCADIWLSWGVPKERIIVVKPGDTLKIKDTEIIAVESFDRTALITAPPAGDIRGHMPDDMDVRAVNYIIKTPGGTIYHSGDSHFSNHYFKHGLDYEIDVALASFGENPPACTDKMTSSDCLRMAENLRTKVLIPFHYDIWSNMLADPAEIELLYNYKKERLDYKFKPYIWQVGGKYVFPDDMKKRKHMFPRGFEDAFTDEPNIPFESFL